MTLSIGSPTKGGKGGEAGGGAPSLPALIGPSCKKYRVFYAPAIYPHQKVVGGGEGGEANSMKNIGKTGFTCFTPFGRHCMKSGFVRGA